MDSLSDTPNITNLIKTCIRTSGQCHILFSEEAGNDIICAEIVLLQKVLNDLVDLPDSDSWQYLSAPLRQCQADLEALRLKFGGRQSPRQEDDKTKISRTRTSTWYLSREDVDKALTAIKRCRTSFELDLGTYNLNIAKAFHASEDDLETTSESDLSQGISNEKEPSEISVFSNPVHQNSHSINQQPLFTPFADMASQTSIIHKVFDLMRSPLYMEEAEVGFILMWTHPEATQMAKVYVTKRSNVVVRLRNVKTTCGYEPQLFCQEEVLCANFLKRLLYTELQNCRRVESKCSGCNRIHYRWLEIKSEHVRALLNRWGKWMKLEPYGGRGELVSFWSSAILEAPKLETLEQFHGWLDETIELAERAEHERSMVQRPSADSTAHKETPGSSPEDARLAKKSDTTALLFAAASGDEAYARTLLMRFEPDIEAKDSKGEMPLYLAAANGHVKIVRWLLENGANVNFQVSITKMTPLHVAAKNGHQDVVMALMAAGADANYITVFEESPLCIAARHGHQAVVQSLIAAGADVNSINFCEESPLYIAARQGHQAVAHSLIGAGANVNSKDELQRSPLFEAAKYGHQAVVQSLIAAGANVDCKDCLQNSPLHIAALRGHKEVARLLLQRSRELNVVIEEKVLMIVDVLMSSSSETQKRADTDQDLQSVASVGTFSDSGFYSGSQISQALIMAAKEQLLEIFATDGELQVLYKESTQKISREKFIRNFKRLMRKYCLELKPRANPIEKGIVIFLGRQAIWFADEIYRAFKPVDVSLRNAMDGLAKQKPDKIRQLDKFLSQHMQGFPLEDMETQQIRDDDGGENGNKSDASDSGGSDGDVSLDPDIEDPYFQGINLLKDFLVSGTPFQNLKENFRQFVRQNCPKHLIIIPEVCEQSRDATTITSPSPSFPGIRSTSYRLLVFNYLRRLFRPRIMDGYQRITWNCGCGESMYSDVKELYSGGAQSLQETLRLSAAAVSEAASNQTNIMTPSPAHLHSADTGQGSSCDQKSPIRPLDTDLSSTPTTDNAPDGNTEPLTAEIVKRYLLLCVNTSKRVHLEQIDVTYTGDDQVLFQGIRQAYYNTRKSQNTGYFLTIPGFLALLFGEISFSRPKLANFVRFELVPMKASVHAAVLDFPTLPPEEEVKVKKRYHYVPCPKDIENPLLQVQFLHEYFKPGQHLGKFWLNRLPKKLKEKLFLNTDGLAIGWGIHIVEELNLFAFGLVAIGVVALSGVLSVIYSICARDVSGGFGVGAYMVAAQAVVLATLFFKWQQA